LSNAIDRVTAEDCKKCARHGMDQRSVFVMEFGRGNITETIYERVTPNWW